MKPQFLIGFHQLSALSSSLLGMPDSQRQAVFREGGLPLKGSRAFETKGGAVEVLSAISRQCPDQFLQVGRRLLDPYTAGTSPDWLGLSRVDWSATEKTLQSLRKLVDGHRNWRRQIAEDLRGLQQKDPRTFWGVAARLYNELNRSVPYWQEQSATVLRPAGALPKNSRVLVVRGGTGPEVIPLLQQGFDVDVVEWSPHMLWYLLENTKGIEGGGTLRIYEGTLQQALQESSTIFTPGSYQMVVARNVLQLARNSLEEQHFLAWAREMCGFHGTVSLTCPSEQAGNFGWLIEQTAAEIQRPAAEEIDLMISLLFGVFPNIGIQGQPSLGQRVAQIENSGLIVFEADDRTYHGHSVRVVATAAVSDRYGKTTTRTRGVLII